MSAPRPTVDASQISLTGNPVCFDAFLVQELCLGFRMLGVVFTVQFRVQGAGVGFEG